ncbi:MAG: hypothetical protein GY869_17080, partial [Planctomycetes bacterium]|nr:hypothetical protein [Planctomycetota bacterium]
TEPADFTIISDGSYVEAPVEWTEFTYDLSAYDGQDVYVAIECVTEDAFILFIDDFTVNSSGGQVLAHHPPYFVQNPAAMASNSNKKADKSSTPIDLDRIMANVNQDDNDAPSIRAVLEGYTLLRNGDVLVELGSDETEYTDSTVENGVEYCYSAVANFDEGDSNPSNEDCATVYTGPVLCPMQNLTATADNANDVIDIAWEAPEDDCSGGWIQWDDGENNDAIGLTNGGTFYWAARFDVN